MDLKLIKHLLHTLCLPVLLEKQKQLFPRKRVARLTHMLQARDSYLSLVMPFSFLQKPTFFHYHPPFSLSPLCNSVRRCHWIGTASSAQAQPEHHINEISQ